MVAQARRRHWDHTVRNAANVANLSTPLGLLVATAGRGRLRRRGHLLVADRVRLPRFVQAGALTVGSVVLVPRRELEEVQARHPALLQHEDAHAWQYAGLVGLPFVPLYLLAMGWSWLRTGDRASANPFEIQAGLAEGGYRRRETRPLRAGLVDLGRRVRRRR